MAVCRPLGCISRLNVGSSNAGRRRPTWPLGAGYNVRYTAFAGYLYAFRKEASPLCGKVSLRFPHAFGAPVTVAPAASRFPSVAASGALPRNSLACSAAGGASAVSAPRKVFFLTYTPSEKTIRILSRLRARNAPARKIIQKLSACLLIFHAKSIKIAAAAVT